ncbi:Uncharacterized protein TCM_008266 [Theobroma cacao]|uniref:Uncharacterized protein n=1 Tax=Theobroma cacao TaxID=3641 RepID=A0A061E3N1_THECC|nr:Uncharacterized protein TCM_008266 [Theobroma cacao]
MLFKASYVYIIAIVGLFQAFFRLFVEFVHCCLFFNVVVVQAVSDTRVCAWRSSFCCCSFSGWSAAVVASQFLVWEWLDTQDWS